MTPCKRISCLLLATVLFVKSFGLPSTQPVPDSSLEKVISEVDFDNTFKYECPKGWTETGTWCDRSEFVTKQCTSDESTQVIYEHMVSCDFWARCQGSAKGGPQPRRATCVPQIGKLAWNWVTDKMKGAASLQCASFTPNGAPADAIAVQINHPSDVEQPPLPIFGQIWYENASYPIETVMQDVMVPEGGSFAFIAPFDTSQTLDFCVNTGTQLDMTFGLVESSRSGGLNNITFDEEITIHDRELLDTDHNYVSSQRRINLRAINQYCLASYVYSESWCTQGNNADVLCVGEDDPTETMIYNVICGWLNTCEGSRETDPPARHATCVPKIVQKWRWATDKLKGASILQCVNFKATGVSGADAIGVSVDNPDHVPSPQMPLVAALFIAGASYANEVITQGAMDLWDGLFAFVNPIDLTQTLSFCVNTAVVLPFTWGLINAKPKVGSASDSELDIH